MARPSPFKPTDRQRADVTLWAADDWSEARMARQMGLSKPLLRRHFAVELQRAADAIRAQVLRTLHDASEQACVPARELLLKITASVAPRPSTPTRPAAARAAARPLAATAKRKASREPRR